MEQGLENESFIRRRELPKGLLGRADLNLEKGILGDEETAGDLVGGSGPDNCEASISVLAVCLFAPN